VWGGGVSGVGRWRVVDESSHPLFSSPMSISINGRSYRVQLANFSYYAVF